VAARTDHASLRDVGLWSNPLLLWGLVFEIAFTGLLIYVPVFNRIVGTAPLPWYVLVLISPFPVIVWGIDELSRARRRRSRPAVPAAGGAHAQLRGAGRGAVTAGSRPAHGRTTMVWRENVPFGGRSGDERLF
jgi:hypothetical protein